ncbi:MAG: S-layer homology domain-containing protein [Clostridia bacterium]|nr:S-layer homology domain-containing protein [Clostridia bacterium]
MKLSKVLSLVLAIAMLLSVPTFAAFTDVAADANYAEAVTVLSALEIINGYEDGSFRPDGKITRAEYSAIICRAIGMGDAAQGSVTDSFTDVAADHWANGYIATAQNAGIINGMGDGTFAPEAEVTYEQAVKMLVCALGYTNKAEALGGYPTGHMMVAIQESMTVGTSNAPGGASRATVARLTYNSLNVPLMEQTSFGADAKFEPVATKSLLWSKLDAVTAEAKIESVPLGQDAENVTLTAIKANKVAEANEYEVPVSVKINGVNLVGLQGLKATVVIDKSSEGEEKLLCVVPKAGKNVELTIDPAMVADVGTSTVEYYKTNDDDRVSKIKLDESVSAYVNLEERDFEDALDEDDAVAYRFVDTDNNGAYDTLFVDREQVFVVGSVNTTSNKIFKATDAKVTASFDQASITLDPEDETVTWTIKNAEGAEIALADIQAGDVVAVKESTVDSNTHYEITVSNTVVEGTITETFVEIAKVDNVEINKFKIGETEYTTLDGSEMKPGATVTAKVYGDKVVDYTVAKGIQNYGMVLAANRAEDFGVTYQLQILNQAGEIVTYNFAEKVNGEAPEYASTSDMEAAFQVGDMIAYELNKDNQIKSIDCETGFEDAYVLDETDKMVTGVDTYRPTAGKLGSYYITDSTVVFATAEDKADMTKEDAALSTTEIFDEDINYTFSLIANAEKEVLAVILYNATANIDYTTYPIVVTKLATVTVEGERRTKLFGYVNGEDVEIILADDAEESATDLTVGDIALYTTNAVGEMEKAFVLADKVGDNFVVKANSYNAITGEGAKDDGDTEVAGNYVTLDGTMTIGDSVALTGFGAAGKAYKVQKNLLRLVDANDYADTFDSADDKRDYTFEADEDRINDFFVNANAVAYQYNANTGKFKVTTIADVETDYATNDYQNKAQTDNDDFVYVYNYDGETKLVLIVNVDGDK